MVCGGEEVLNGFVSWVSVDPVVGQQRVKKRTSGGYKVVVVARHDRIHRFRGYQ